MIMRYLLLQPAPQSLLHGDQGDHSVMVQSTGQGTCCEQLVCWVVAGHDMPSCCGWELTTRLRTRTPESPQDTLHAPQVAQADTAQSTPQMALLHERVSVSAPHATPPFAASWSMLRRRLC